jgi:AraC family transcriptional regulator
VEHAGFMVTDARFPPGLVLPPHFHDRTVVAVTLGGAWDSVMDRRPHASTPGMLLTEPAGERHANHFGAAGAHVLIVQPDSVARADTLAPVSAALGRINHAHDAMALALARRLSCEIGLADTAAPLAIEGLALELVSVLARRDARSGSGDFEPPWIRRVVDYLHAHRLESPTTAALTAVAGVHPAHLVRAFRRYRGMTPAAYLRRLRLDWAAERLAAGDMPIVDLAAAAGFADQSHFTRAFRRHTGLPPRRYRDALR